MSSNVVIEKVVREYFDNAIIIDDQLKLEEIKVPILEQKQLGPIRAVPGLSRQKEQTAATNEEEIIERPNFVYNQFVYEGFVTLPFQFNTSDYEKHFSCISNVLKNVKMVIIDWDLNDPKAEPLKQGDSAIKIIKHFIEQKKGIKCVVIYTQEDIKKVAVKVGQNFEIFDNGNFFQEIVKSDEEGRSVFGFILNKTVPPKEIVSKISTILYKDKAITLHFMDCANKLEQNLGITLTKYNTPFEKAVYSQIFSSHISDLQIPTFLNEILLSSILEKTTSCSTLNLLFIVKSEKFKDLLKEKLITKEKLKEFEEVLKINSDNIWNLLQRDGFLVDFIKLFEDGELASFNILEEKILTLLKTKYLPGETESNNNKLAKDLILLILLFDNYIHDKDKTKFKESFSSQLYLFTRLFKCYEDGTSNIQTGSVYKDKEGKFFLCITPFCDTFRPEKIENSYKFISGKVVPTYDKNDLKNTKDNCFFMAIPLNDEKKVNIIKWDFYNTQSYYKDEISNNLIKVTTLKREYIQNVINRYISYHSRAGVDELFYKESEYIDTFIKLIK